jgi:hypothetical protein
MVILKEPFLGWWSNYEGRLKSSWTHLITLFTFLRSGWSIVRSTLLAKGGTVKQRPSLHLHKVPTWSDKVSLISTDNENFKESQFIFIQFKICCIKSYTKKVNCHILINENAIE